MTEAFIVVVAAKSVVIYATVILLPRSPKSLMLTCQILVTEPTAEAEVRLEATNVPLTFLTQAVKRNTTKRPLTVETTSLKPVGRQWQS